MCNFINTEINIFIIVIIISLCVSYRSAHIETRRFTQLVIAEHFTEVDGNSRIYIARDGVTPGLSAWPLPHDAPYKPHFDHWIQAVLEVCRGV